MIRVSAPSKIILFGEHGVVYDRLGVAAAIDRRVRLSIESRPPGLLVDWEWGGIAEELREVHSRFKEAVARKDLQALQGMGFREAVFVAVEEARQRWGGQGFTITREKEDPVKGTGGSAATFAAIALGIARLAGKEPSRQEISEVAYAGDCVMHGGIPSGIDNTVISHGGYLSYRKSEGLKSLPIGFSTPIVVVNTLEQASTKQMVLGVKDLREKKPALAESVLRLMEHTAQEGLQALRDGDQERLGRLMFVNHELLRQIGVSTAKLDQIVELARKEGALGAKLTGAGGGGCAIVLPTSEEQARELVEAYKRAGFEAFTARLGAEGVRTEG